MLSLNLNVQMLWHFNTLRESKEKQKQEDCAEHN